MLGKPQWQAYAELMLGSKNLSVSHSKLYHRLQRIDALAAKCGGGLASRQTVAVVALLYLVEPQAKDENECRECHSANYEGHRPDCSSGPGRPPRIG